jgi:subtilisin family serine protease
VAYTAPLFSSNGETVAIIPEIVVRVKPGVDVEEVQRLCKAAGCMIRTPMEFTTQEYLIEVRGPDAEAVFAAVETLSRNPEVEWACPNAATRPSFGSPVAQGVFPNDEYFPRQWSLCNTGQFGATRGVDIRAPEAWEITTGDPNVVVAVIDTGVDPNHPDLINNLIAGYDFLDDDILPDPMAGQAFNSHGTHCAGLIAGESDNEIGVAGVTWNCKIMPIRNGTFQLDGTSQLITHADTASAFRWAAVQGADVLSNSWGGKNPAPIIRSGVLDVSEPGGIGRNGKGCIVIFCAMNDGGRIDYYPQKYPEVITVGATDHNDVRWSYSNYGPELDIAGPSGERWYFAPGEGPWSKEGNMLWTTDLTGPEGMSSHPRNPYPDVRDYVPIGGTSMACPIVAGVAALILSLEPDLTQAEVRHFLECSAKDLGDPGWDQYYGWGRVDARAALDMVLAKRADLNGDWRVDLDDLVILIESWEIDDVLADIAPATRRDGIVDDQDLELLMRYWQVEIPEMNAAVD